MNYFISKKVTTKIELIAGEVPKLTAKVSEKTTVREGDLSKPLVSFLFDILEKSPFFLIVGYAAEWGIGGYAAEWGRELYQLLSIFIIYYQCLQNTNI